MTKLYMLGTGHAITTKCYNTCFALENKNGIFLVDGGGGNGILVQTEAVGINLSDVQYMFVTHAHTDHFLGALWAIRGMAETAVPIHRYVFCHDIVKELMDRYIQDLLNKKQLKFTDEFVHVIEVKDGEEKDFLGMHLTFFDIDSVKAKQFGFSAILDDGKKLVCLGDEPFNKRCEKYVRDADLMMAESFCLYEERDIYHPYEISHSTALDAGRVAQELNAKNLLIYHTEDSDLAHRKVKYSAEAKENFKGNVFVPDDLEVLTI